MSHIKVVKVEAVDWPDASLGVTGSGGTYAQVVTPGYRITLSVDSKVCVYHTNRAGRVVLAS